MNKIWLCALTAVLLTLSTSAAYSHELENFRQLKKAIQRGKSVNIVTFINQCQSNRNTSFPADVTGAYQPPAFMVVGDNIYASDLHFTLNNPGNKDKPVYEFVTYTFDSKNSLNMKSQVLEAATYAPLGDPREYTCSIGSSVKLFASSSRQKHSSED